MSIRLAYVTSELPAPANSGTLIRSSRLARALTALGPVTLYCRSCDAEVEAARGNRDLEFFARTRIKIDPPEIHARLVRVLTVDSMALRAADDEPLAAMLSEDHRSCPFDVVICQQVFTADVARALPGVPMVLDEHNIESQALSQVVASAAKGKAGQGLLPPANVEGLEREAWDRAALITCPTESDAMHIRQCTATPVRVVPNGADVAESSFRLPSTRTGKEILFVGAFFWPPNAKAARFLVKDVLPRVRSVESEARVILCGKSPGLDVTLLQRSGVEVTGTVPTVAPYLDRAAVYANALTEGAGSSLKVVEALSYGVPLVSTPLGVRGYPLEAVRHYLSAEDAEGFARAILAILGDPAAFDSMAVAGRAFAEAHSWERIGARFAEAVANVAGRGGVKAD